MQPAIRKAAILIQALDPSSADVMLAQLDSATARRVREAARKLPAIDTAEQQAVLEEFFTRGEDAPPRALTPADRIAATAADEVILEQRVPTPAARRPFQFLEKVEITRLAARLRFEHPQTIAIVAAHAPRAVAAELVWRLPESLRNDVIVRVMDWQGTDPQLLAEVEKALEVSLAAAPSMPAEAAGLDAAKEILAAISVRDRDELLDALARVDAAKAELLRFSEHASNAHNDQVQETLPVPTPGDEFHREPVPEKGATISLQVVSPRDEPESGAGADHDLELAFADFLRFDDRTLSRVFAEADPATALLALAGAEPRLVERLMRRLPRKEAARLHQRVEKLGSFRLHDIELAQAELTRVATRLADQGKIRLPVRRIAA